MQLSTRARSEKQSSGALEKKRKGVSEEDVP